MVTPKFGHKMKRKSWDSSDINSKWEDRKIAIAFIVIALVMIILAFILFLARK